MGAPLWTADEEEVFEKIIIPMSDYATGQNIKDSGMSFEDLAPIMQKELDNRGIHKRTYTGENLFQHYYQRHGKRAKERNQLASQQPLSTATASGPLAPIRDTTPLRSSRASSATPSHLARLRQVGEYTEAAMYYDRASQTDVSISPIEDIDGSTRILDYASTHPVAPAHTSDNNHASLHSFASAAPTSIRDDMMNYELDEYPNKSRWDGYVEDDADDHGMYSKPSENRMTYSGEYPAEGRPSSNRQTSEYAAKPSSASSTHQPSTSQGRKKIIAPKRPYGASPVNSQKRQRQEQSDASFGSTVMNQHHQSSSIVAQPPMSQPNNNKLPPMGVYTLPKKMTRQEAMFEVLRKKELAKAAQASTSLPVAALIQQDLQKPTLNHPINGPEQDPFGPQIEYGRVESARPESRTSVQSTGSTFSRRRGKDRLAPLRSPPRLEEPATVESTEELHALANKYTFQTSPGHSYHTLSPSQHSTPGGPIPASPLKFTTPTKDQRAHAQQYEPSPLQMMSNFDDYNSAKNARYGRESEMANADSPSAGRGSSGGRGSGARVSRNVPPVPSFNDGLPAGPSTQQGRPAAKNTSMGSDGPASHTLIPNESIFKKRPAAEDPEDTARPAPKHPSPALKVQSAYDTDSPSPQSIPGLSLLSNTETSYAVQTPPQDPFSTSSISVDDLFFEPGSPSPPPADPKKRTSTGSATSEPSKPRKVVPKVPLAYDTEKSRLPALPAGYVRTLSSEPARKRRSSRGSRATSSVHSSASMHSPAIVPFPDPNISRSGASTPDLALFATTKPKEKVNMAVPAPTEPEEGRSKAEIRCEDERKASIAHAVEKVKERTGIP
ncbi:uncharacterized protein PAC_07032 [Phialocephala subalpina]|uniref:Uncharacterized protein n=1 Tax=Phialocephala subalpina TaxID=576137 RepID=A0A1L7WWM3_9HELO|nr:uncharacterized protein PAC_07032 [Phialocephala subalpina]